MAETDAATTAKPTITVGGRYVLVRKIGNGSFGNIYLGRDLEGAENENLAIKLERKDAHTQPQLLNEHRCYQVEERNIN